MLPLVSGFHASASTATLSSSSSNTGASIDATEAFIRLESSGEHVLFLRPGYVLASLPAAPRGEVAVRFPNATASQVEPIVTACVQSLRLGRLQAAEEPVAKAAAAANTASSGSLNLHEGVCISTALDLRATVAIACGVLQRTALRHAGIDDHMAAAIVTDTLNLLCSFCMPAPAYSVTATLLEGPAIMSAARGRDATRLRSLHSLTVHASTMPTVSRRWQECPVLTLVAYASPLSLIETVGGPAATQFMATLRAERAAEPQPHAAAATLAAWLDLWATIERVVPSERDGLEVVRLLCGIIIALEVRVVDDANLRPTDLHSANGVAALLVVLRRREPHPQAMGEFSTMTDEAMERQLVRTFLAETQTTPDPLVAGVRRLCVVADELASFLSGWIVDCCNNTLLTMVGPTRNPPGGSSLVSITIICVRTTIAEDDASVAAASRSAHAAAALPPHDASAATPSAQQRRGHQLQGLFSRGDVSVVAARVEKRSQQPSAAASSMIMKQLETIEKMNTTTTTNHNTAAAAALRQGGASRVVSIRHLPGNIATDHVVSWAARLHHVESSLVHSDDVVMDLMKGRGQLMLDLLLAGSRVAPVDLQRAVEQGGLPLVVRELKAHLSIAASSSGGSAMQPPEGSGAPLPPIALLPSPTVPADVADPLVQQAAATTPLCVVRHTFGTVVYDLTDAPWLPTVVRPAADPSHVSLFSCLSDDVLRAHSSSALPSGGGTGDTNMFRSGSIQNVSSRSGSTSTLSTSIVLDNAQERQCLNAALQASFLRALRGRYATVTTSIEALFSIAFKRVEHPVFVHVVPAATFPLYADDKAALRHAVGCSIANQLLQQQLAPQYIKSVPFEHFCRVFFPILQRTKPHALKLVSQRQSQEQLSDSDFIDTICAQLGLLPNSYRCSDYVLMLTGKGWSDLSAVKTADEGAARHEALVRQAAQNNLSARWNTSSSGGPASPGPPRRASVVRIAGTGMPSPQWVDTVDTDEGQQQHGRSVAFDSSAAVEPLSPAALALTPTAQMARAASMSHMQRRHSSPPTQHTAAAAALPRRQSSPMRGGAKPSDPSRNEPPWRRAAPPIRLTQHVAARIDSFTKQGKPPAAQVPPADGDDADVAVEHQRFTAQSRPTSFLKKSTAGKGGGGESDGTVFNAKQQQQPRNSHTATSNTAASMARPASAASFFTTAVGGAKQQQQGRPSNGAHPTTIPGLPTMVKTEDKFGFADFDFMVKEQLRE